MKYNFFMFQSKWSSFTSSEVPSENYHTEGEQPNILQQRTNNTTVRTNFPQNNTAARTNFPQNNTSARTNFLQNNSSQTNNPQYNKSQSNNPNAISWPSFPKKSLGGKSFQSSKTSISAQPLLPKPTVSQPVLTDFTKKFLVNRKQNQSRR